MCDEKVPNFIALVLNAKQIYLLIETQLKFFPKALQEKFTTLFTCDPALFHNEFDKFLDLFKEFLKKYESKLDLKLELRVLHKPGAKIYLIGRQVILEDVVKVMPLKLINAFLLLVQQGLEQCLHLRLPELYKYTDFYSLPAKRKLGVEGVNVKAVTAEILPRAVEIRQANLLLNIQRFYLRPNN